MNVLWLVSWYPNKTNPFDGDFIERHAKAVSQFIKLTVLFVVKDAEMPYGDFKTEKNHEGNLTVYKCYYGPSSPNKLIEKILSFKKYRQYQKKIFNQIEAEQDRPDIIHVHVAMKAGMLALQLKNKLNIPFIVTEHWSGYYKHTMPNIYTGNKLINRFNKKVLQQAKLLITVSKHLGQTINNSFVKLPFAVMPNVVDTNLFFYKPFTPARFRFIHPSGLIDIKNPEGILAACKIVKDRGCDFELQFIGAKNTALEKIAQENGLLNTVVFFKDAISYNEVAAQMQQSSCLLMFSRHENMSCVVLEALCCGLPVICTNVGGLPEVINNENGILVESENIPQLASAMITMIETHSKFNRQHIAVEAQQKFNYTTVAKQHIAVYENLLNQQQV